MEQGTHDANDNNSEILWDVVKDLNRQGKHEPLISGILGALVLIFSTALGTIANILAFRYFLTKNKTFFNAFKLVALSDLFICQLSTFYGISLVAGRAPLMFANPIFCMGWSTSWRILVRFSLHLVAIQCVLRTIKICRPLQILPKHILTVTVSFDLILITALIIRSTTIFPAIFDGSYASCFGKNIKQAYETPIMRRMQVSAVIYAALPYLVVLICCALCSLKLLRPKSATTGRPWDLSRHRSYSIMSLLVFSLTGIILNLPNFGHTFLRISMNYDTIMERQDGIYVWFLIYGNVIFREIIVTLNSIMNPLIFLWRMSELRGNISSTVLNPIYATYVRCCKKRAFHESIELAEIKANVCNKQKNLKSNPENDAKLKNGTDEPAIIALDNNSSNSIKQLSRGGEGRNQNLRLADMEPLHIENVIVHRNALDLVDQELVHRDILNELDSESCECECCFYEQNGVKNFNFHNNELRSPDDFVFQKALTVYSNADFHSSFV